VSYEEEDTHLYVEAGEHAEVARHPEHERRQVLVKQEQRLGLRRVHDHVLLRYRHVNADRNP
jgi:hypothetical protein